MWMIRQSLKKSIDFFSSILFPSYCYVCHKEGTSFCDTCLKQQSYAVDSPAPCITSIYSFKNPAIKKAIHAIKYFHRKDLILPLTEEISHTILEKGDFSSVIVPIPMPLLRKYIRGYNQAEAIAKIISKQTKLPIRTDIVKRASLEKRQVMTTSRRERLKNQRNAFTVVGNVTGMSIILIDDVTTTGATLLEARRILLQRGAVHVEAFTIAH